MKLPSYVFHGSLFLHVMYFNKNCKNKSQPKLNRFTAYFTFYCDFSPVSSSPATSSTEKPTGKDAKEKEPPPPPQEYALILADPELMKLPLEAMKAFSAESIVSLSRDFSLQLFYHRYHQELPAGQLFKCNNITWYFV